MKIQKAIDTLNLAVQNPYHYEPPDIRRAMKLGIEALKREQARRSKAFSVLWGALPGETP